jgi:hypothetical protein
MTLQLAMDYESSFFDPFNVGSSLIDFSENFKMNSDVMFNCSGRFGRHAEVKNNLDVYTIRRN